MTCPNCRGARVCADRPLEPWPHDGCGAEGAPCVCNPRAEVEWREAYAEAPREPDEPAQ